MANRNWRGFQLWLFLSRFLFLSWFVLFVIPVIQEVGTTSDDVSTEKSSPVVMQLKPTPHLVSLSQTETIIANIDVSSLTVSPSIAPATPWEDINVSHPVPDAVRDDESRKHASDSELGQNEESQSEMLDKEIKYEGKTDQFDEKTSIDGSDDNEDDFQITGPDFNNQDTNSESPSVESGIVNDHGDLKKDSEIKHDGGSQTKDNIDADKDITKHDLKFSEEETIDLGETVTRDVAPEDVAPGDVAPGDVAPGDVAPGDEEQLHENTQGSQDAEGDEDIAGTHNDHEDMPSFKEWSKKFLAEEEQKNKVQQSNEKGNQETNTQAKKTKSDRKQNNYASVDCGANVLENNIEAQNPGSILLENKDFYMLNPCSANIWFIVELCDHVQVTSLQLANFELFSSAIATFQVSFSTRYPTREWEQLHTFTARSEKAIQTFKLEPIFAKYIKVEQQSYHGSEHYCPWSLLRVYGNSMVEEYEEHESSSQEAGATVDDGASSNVKEDQNVSGGILQTATDAVLNFVKETAKKLVKSEGNSSNVNSTNSTNYTGLPEQALNSETPRSIVQLMDHEDFEASCHEVNADEVLASSKICLPGTACSSAAPPQFFEIVYNVCRRDFRNTKACFNELAKSIAVNKTTALPNMHSNPKSKDIVLDNGDIVEKNGMVNNPSEVESGSSNDEEQLYKYTESSDTTDKMTTEHDSSLDTVASSKTLMSSEVKISENTPIIVAILPSSSSSTISQSVTGDKVILNKINHPSSPTPLAQPPLDVKQVVDSEEPPTEPTVTNTEGHEENNPNNTHPSEPTVTMVNSGQLSATKHVTPNQGSVETMSSESIALVSPDKLISSIADNTAAECAGTNSESHHQESHGDEGQDMLDKGSNEEKPNPDVDVLKITLTDEETKEGTAEPEQMAQNDLDVSDRSKSENNITLKDGTMNDTDVPNEPTSQVDSGGSSLGKNPETLDIINESESDEKELFENHEKGATVEITNEKESESEQKEEQIEQENGKIEGNQNSDINDEEMSSKVDEIVENNVLKIDSVINSEKCDVKEYEAVEVDEEGTKNAKRKIEADSLGGTISVGNGQTNSKKESIFVAMSRKIKALEQNVTMTNLFLEELSQRYRKSLEEMQKKIEKKLSVMSKNSKLLTQVNLSHNITIIALTSRLQNVEEKLNEATLRLKVVNQEVVERHVLGMCIQFIIVLLLWYFRGNSSVGNTQKGRNANLKISPLEHGTHIDGDDQVGNAHPKNSSVEDIGRDSMAKSQEEATLSKCSSETTADGKRRRRRRNRPLSVTSEQFLDQAGTSQGQNIVTKTAGLLFHTPGFHTKGEKVQEGILKDATQRSCSADGLNDISQIKDERKLNTKKSAASPKAKKIVFRHHGGKIENATSKVRSDLFHSDYRFDATKDGHQDLLRSKSVEECGSNGLHFYNNTNNDFPSGAHKSSSSPSVRCSMQSDSYDQLNNQKSKWIWGFG